MFAKVVSMLSKVVSMFLKVVSMFAIFKKNLFLFFLS
jgi:hypothetical protein